MFIKKDLRKIPQILTDGAASPGGGETEELRLARRHTEFHDGTLSILCGPPPNLASLRNLTSLSLYDCGLRSLDGLGAAAAGAAGCPNLRELNVGRNPLSTLPDDLASIGTCAGDASGQSEGGRRQCSLQSLWCDDCRLEGPVPACVMEMTKLKHLRMGNNLITTIPEELGKNLAHCLEVLCLDNNRIECVPDNLGGMYELRSLMLRQNQITTLPKGVPGREMTELTLLHVSSNKLTALPDSVIRCTTLETIYANGNRIRRIPDGFGESLSRLKRLNVSSNLIDELPTDFVDRFGLPDPQKKECTKDSGCTVLMMRNPLTEKKKDASPGKGGGGGSSNGSNTSRSVVGGDLGVTPMEIASN